MKTIHGDAVLEKKGMLANPLSQLMNVETAATHTGFFGTRKGKVGCGSVSTLMLDLQYKKAELGFENVLFRDQAGTVLLLASALKNTCDAILEAEKRELPNRCSCTANLPSLEGEGTEQEKECCHSKRVSQ